MAEDKVTEFDYKLLKSNRNNDMIFYQNYFYMKYYNNGSKQFWRCQNRKCCAKLCTPVENITNIEVLKFRNHVLSENDISKIFLNSKIKELAEKNAYSTHTVYSLATSNAKRSELPIINKRQIYQNVANYRKRKSIIVDTSKSFEELNATSLRGERFCLYVSGVPSSNRIIILATRDNLDHLEYSNVMIADGTFKVCPKEFFQLYILHGQIRNKIQPLIYILMKTKKEEDYFKTFNFIFKKFKSQFPLYIVIDFEYSSFVAFKKATKSSIFFCLFHFGQCIWRKLQKHGLSNEFNKKCEFRIFIKCITSLAFVPVDYVEEEYNKVLKRSETFKHMNLFSFFEYFEKNFLKGSKYPIDKWNAHFRVLNDIPLTSNSAENFNRHFGDKFDQCHPGLSTFLDKLKVQQSNVEDNVEFLLSDFSKEKTSAYKDKLTPLKDICINYKIF